MLDGRLERVAEEFWDRAGGELPFPRDLEGPILWSLPLAVLKLPRLAVRDVQIWLERRQVPFKLECADRPLRACLVAYGGKGCILLDGTDPEDEQRFSLAHEAAHFLLDYQEPRRQAEERLGAPILEVFEGIRKPTTHERTDAVLAGAHIGVHTHLMDRDLTACGRVTRAEQGADRLALELLAPMEEVKRRLKSTGGSSKFADVIRQAQDLLLRDFGLPEDGARSYAHLIARECLGGPSLREWLGIE